MHTKKEWVQKFPHGLMFFSTKGKPRRSVQLSSDHVGEGAGLQRLRQEDSSKWKSDLAIY